MTDVIEVSYTGDLLAHRRCARAWAYEKRAGFQPYRDNPRVVWHSAREAVKKRQEV